MKAKGSISKTAMWILMGLLILGLGGFGITNLGGNISTVGAVGDAEIDLNDYARGLRAEVRALEAERDGPVSFAQARADGAGDRVLARLVAEAALDHETARLGVSIGDRNLRDQLLDIPAFHGMDGQFDRAAYEFALDQSGLTEAGFEEDIREEAARTLVQGAVISGVSAPRPYVDTLMTYVGENRAITLATLQRSDLTTGLPEPDDEDLRAWHQSHLPEFTTPETRAITYAWLTPEMMLDEVEVDEDTLRAAYEDRADEFDQPERRLVERLVFSDTATAEAAAARIAEGEATFEDLVVERGLDLADVDMGDVARADLGAAGGPVFAAVTGDVVGPVETDLGPALFRVNGVLAAQTVSFEDAEPDLREEIAADRARRAIDARIDAVDDLLAGGATLEQVADETELELGEIRWHPGIGDGIAAYPGFREAAIALEPGDFPQVRTLDDGSIFAMRLDEIVDPEIQPLEEVREGVRAAWMANAVAEALRAQIEPEIAALENGGDFADAGLAPREITGLTRRGFEPGTPPEFIETVFGMDEGEVRLIEGDGRLFVLRLDGIDPPDGDDPDLAQLRDALADQVANDIATDLYQLLAADIRARAGVTIDSQAINAVHANFQ